MHGKICLEMPIASRGCPLSRLAPDVATCFTGRATATMGANPAGLSRDVPVASEFCSSAGWPPGLW